MNNKTASERIRDARELDRFNLSQRSASAMQLNLACARGMGSRLADVFPVPANAPHGAVPEEFVTDISDHITAVVAEMLQAWLDAGSERDVTYEELGPAIEDHVRDWAL